jgi:hypothetical protein
MDYQAGAHLTSALTVVGLMNWLINNPKFKWLQKGKTATNRTVSIILAGLIHLGIGWTWSTLSTGAGGYHLGIDIPALGVIWHNLFAWGGQYLYQETGYQGLQVVKALNKISNSLSSGMQTPTPKA